MIKAILASTTNGGIGNRGTLPWPKNSADLKWFREHTENNIVVMGRNTWDDPKLPKPLPNRVNCVVSNRVVNNTSVRRLSGDIKEQVKLLQSQFPSKDIYIIGGKQLFDECADIIEQVIWTRIKGPYFTDVRIELDRFLAGFRIISVKAERELSYEIWKRDIYFDV